MFSIKGIFNNSNNIQQAPSAISAGMTYQQFGVQCAGQSDASIHALNPALQKIVYNIKREQQNNIALQQKFKDDTQKDIDGLMSKVETENNNLNAENDKLKEIDTKIQEVKQQLSDIQSGNESGPTKEARLNLWIGGVILVLITVYLIIFYCSASFSAFFKVFGADTIPGVSDTILDGRAMAEAWSYGIEAVLFTTLLPFLFMGLGYIIHQIEDRNEPLKVLKIIALYSLTFIFDALIAYHICQKIYNIWTLTQLSDQPAYSFSIAFTSADFWIIIFCGFIAYVIWGLVFSFFMTAVKELDTRNEAKKQMKSTLDSLTSQKLVIKGNILADKNNIVALENQIKVMSQAMNNSVMYDYNSIRLELNNFFGGWISYMKLSAKKDSELDAATNSFTTFISAFDKNAANNSTPQLITNAA